MRSTSHNDGNSQRESGVVQILLVFAMIALIAIASLSIDAGAMYVGRTQIQGASDAAALAAASQMVDRTGPVLTLAAGEAAAISLAGSNKTIGNASVSIASTDISFGGWDAATSSFDPSVDQTDITLVTTANVVARMDGTNNGPVPALLSKVLGRTSFNISSESTALLGFPGTVTPGEVDLPIAIDCCKLKGADCQQDYCATVASPPNGCPLDTPQDGGSPTTVSCLEFFNTPDQNACWTEFDGASTNINTSDLLEIVENGSAVEVSINEPMYLGNGTMTPVIGEIQDKFQGTGSYGSASGQDYYPPFDGTPDSWVVGLPVVECQDSDHCAGGLPAAMVGVVCFEIREVVTAPDKIIRGTFMCPSHPRYQDCDLGGTTPGGGFFGVISTRPVLVR